jgi:hypothetical protein
MAPHKRNRAVSDQRGLAMPFTPDLVDELNTWPALTWQAPAGNQDPQDRRTRQSSLPPSGYTPKAC